MGGSGGGSRHGAVGVGESVAFGGGTGDAGLSSDGSAGRADKPWYDQDAAVERMRAARRAVDKAGGEIVAVRVGGNSVLVTEGTIDVG